MPANNKPSAEFVACRFDPLLQNEANKKVIASKCISQTFFFQLFYQALDITSYRISHKILLSNGEFSREFFGGDLAAMKIKETLK